MAVPGSPTFDGGSGRTKAGASAVASVDTARGGIGQNGAVMKTIRVLLVDDEAAVRQGLMMRLALEPDIDVVGEARDGADAVRKALECGADVVLMDVRMKDVNGLSAAYDLHEHVPDATVIMLSMHDDAATRLMARVAGVDAFVGKSQPEETLLETIRSVALGSGG